MLTVEHFSMSIPYLEMHWAKHLAFSTTIEVDGAVASLVAFSECDNNV